MTTHPTEVLYKYHKELNRPFADSRQMLARALELMAVNLKLDQACFFSWEPEESLLSLRLVWSGSDAMDLEEDIAAASDSPLRAALESGVICDSAQLDYPAIYIPLRWPGAGRSPAGRQPLADTARLGALRMERLSKSRPFTERERELARGLADELEQNLAHIELDQFTREQLGRASALNELTAVFASSLRMEDGMRLILQGIQKYFGFDRVRLYLVNQAERKLKGELSADARGQVRSLAHEQIPLQPGVHRFADIVLGSVSGDTVADKYRDSVVYLPLTVQGKSEGLLIVDNLLSQQPIMQEDMLSLSSFAGQIALAVDNAVLFDRVQELSQYDELTKLPVRRYFTERFHEEMYRAERFNQPLALIWMDVDFFKEINDSYGHQAGDVALREIGRVILSNLRKIDFPCRYGGDEILVLLPQSKAEEASAIAARLSREIGDIKIPAPFSKTEPLKISVSQGIAAYPGDARTADELLARADEALYWSKTHGRGRIAFYGEVFGAKNHKPPAK
ncbi:MAG: sensor domain-containing diguanylate cyclase [Elusimicrobiales bacterium]